MKENYTKPLLAVEVFSLTQPAARDCADHWMADQFTQGDPNQCAYDLGGGVTVFIDPSPCQINGELAGYGCYNNPTEGNYIFRS